MLDQLRQGIHLRGYGQRDPLNEYSREAFGLFQIMLDVIREKCLDCCYCQAREVDRCTAVACSSWPYRFGTNPFSKRRGNPEALLRARPYQVG